MAKRNKQAAVQPVEEEKRTDYVGYDMSATSEFYIYGRGNAEDYDRSVRRLREDLRELAYGERHEIEEEVVPVKKKKNGGAIAVAVLSAVAIVLFLIGKLLPEINLLFVADGKNGLDWIIGIVSIIGQDGISGFQLAELVEVAALALTVLFFAVNLIVGIATVGAKRRGFIKATAVMCLIFALAAIVATIVAMHTVETGLIILSILALANAIFACASKKVK